jgi:DNA-directed RNA polymerase specialized sigma24 family protein
VLAVSLGRGEAEGLLAAHDAYGPDLIGYAEFLLASQPAETDVHLADEAADAVLDALLVSTGVAADLTDPDRMRAWLLALTRNECLRRRSGLGAPPNSEAAELGRRGLGPVDVAALLGFAPAELPGRLPPVETVPAWLRAELVAAAGPDGAERRAELLRQARPFEADGFPVPLDRRRLSGRALAWSAGLAVLIAIGLLVALPTRSAGVAAPAEPVLAAAATPVPSRVPEAAAEPLPTLAETPFGAPAPTAVTTVAPRVTRAPAPAPVTTAAPPARPEAKTAAGTADRDGRGTGVALSWTPVTTVTCGDQWTARLHATTGGRAVSRVVAVTGRGQAVPLRPDGDGWSGVVTGLPTDRPVAVTVFAIGLRPATARLTTSC